MTTLRHTELRRLALNVLTQYAGSVDGAETLAAAARRAYDDLAGAAIPLIGKVGVEALTGRAVHLAQREYAWLRNPRDSEDAQEPFAQVIVCLARQEPAAAAEGAALVFATFAGLLISFIGEPLAGGLLRKAWPNAFSTTPAEDA